MILVLKPDASREQTDELLSRIKSMGLMSIYRLVLIQPLLTCWIPPSLIDYIFFI